MKLAIKMELNDALKCETNKDRTFWVTSHPA